MHGPIDQLPQSDTSPRQRQAESGEFHELKHFRVFDRVEQRLVQTLIDSYSTHQFRPGAVIVEQDEPLQSVMIISRGLVDLTRIEGQREFGVLLLAAHDVLMPAAALFSEPCLVSARALVRTKVCSLPVATVRAVIKESPQLAANLMAVTSGQWRMSVRNILDLSSRTAAQRVGAFLLRLADLQSDSAVPVLPIPKRSLASRLGITAETFSRMLQTVADNGLYLRGRTIIIRDRQRIEKFCGPDPYIERDERELGVFAL